MAADQRANPASRGHSAGTGKGHSWPASRLDRAISDETQLRGELEQRLGVEITAVVVQEVNFVNDTTLVEARFLKARAPRTVEVPQRLRTAA